ncbi:magnesium transporter CorA family protein [Candidatus Daviesbacteria bacterium]|nr:magnesium transporter CorA family protein [Candidatus Daviesbacteria bacterium]
MNIQTVTHNKLTFLNITSLRELESKELRNHYHFSQIHIDDYLSGQQVPKIELNNYYTLIVLDFPFVEQATDTLNETGQHGNGDSNGNGKGNVIKDLITKPVIIPKILFSKDEKRRIRTGHVNFFIGKDFLVVLHDEKTPQIDGIFTDCQKTLKKREELMSPGPSYLFYRIIDVLVDSTYGIMNEIVTSIDQIDLHLLGNYSPLTIVEEISVTRRNLVFLKSMLSPASNIFSDLAHEKRKKFDDLNVSYWFSILDHIRKINTRLESSVELIEGIARSHESLLTAKTNEIVKVLTMFTAMLLPLTFITGIYGMNVVDLPGASTPGVLGLLILMMTGIAGAMALVFKIKKWL